LNLNDLLLKNAVNPAEVLVFRHRLQEPELHKALPWLAAEKPDFYNAIQQTQGPRAESSMLRAGYVASFIGHEAGKALFVGLYKVGKNTPLSFKEYWNIPAYKEMKALYGMQGFRPETDGREVCLWFDLDMVDSMNEWKGRLVVNWPGLERSWYRWADRNEEMSVFCIHPESQLIQGMPEWDDLDLSWHQLSVLPRLWQASLSQWRGIYYIFDGSDQKGYVGSAYGADNLLGRWKNYAKSGHGGNKLLKQRDPKNFRFTILQRVSPDMGVEDVVLLESRWKKRLHTYAPSGLNDN